MVAKWRRVILSFIASIGVLVGVNACDSSHNQQVTRASMPLPQQGMGSPQVDKTVMANTATISSVAQATTQAVNQGADVAKTQIDNAIDQAADATNKAFAAMKEATSSINSQTQQTQQKIMQTAEQLQQNVAQKVTEIQQQIQGQSSSSASATQVKNSAIDSTVGDNKVQEKFVGTLPCASCDGIVTQLTLVYNLAHQPYQFVLKETYLNGNDGNLVNEERGQWLIEKGTAADAGAVVYKLNLVNDNPRFFQRLNNQQLRMLDQHGEPIQSTLNYNLQLQ